MASDPSPTSQELPEEIATAIEALFNAAEDSADLSLSERKRDLASVRADNARSALTAAILSRLREAEAGRDAALVDAQGEEVDAALDRSFRRIAEAERDAALARVERLEKRVNAALDDACRMSAILLMAGEMTAQERRTAQAVANGLAAKVRSALSEAPPQGDQ